MPIPAAHQNEASLSLSHDTASAADLACIIRHLAAENRALRELIAQLAQTGTVTEQHPVIMAFSMNGHRHRVLVTRDGAAICTLHLTASA